MNIRFNVTKGFLSMGIFALCLQANAQKKNIPQSELPGTAKDFITEYFSDQKIVQVVKDVDYLVKTEYEITLGNGFQLEFDGKGDWKDVDGNNTAIPSDFFSKSITDYILQNFPGQQITAIEKKSSGYELELSNGLDIDFNSNGEFVRIDD